MLEARSIEHGELTSLPVLTRPSLLTPVGDATNRSSKPPIDMSLAETCEALVQLQRDRRFCVVSQSRCDRSIEAFIARNLGYRTDAQESDRKALFKLAKSMRQRIEKDPDAVESLVDGVSSIREMVQLSAESRSNWDIHRKNTESRMRQLAKQLPVWPTFAKEVRGLGELGLAVVVGEAGDLSNYSNPAKLWKRLGLAVINGERQRKHTDKNKAEAHGYSPQRRAEVWAFFSDAMFRAVWRGEKDGILAHPLSPYGAEYGRKKAEYLSREWTPAHAENAARRYMTKAVLRDLWAAWRRATATLL